jgi:hypothetical protein
MANADFEMPTLREIEIDLALGSESWQSLRATEHQSPAPAPAEHAAPTQRRSLSTIVTRLLRTAKA